MSLILTSPEFAQRVNLLLLTFTIVVFTVTKVEHPSMTTRPMVWIRQIKVNSYHPSTTRGVLTQAITVRQGIIGNFFDAYLQYNQSAKALK